MGRKMDLFLVFALCLVAVPILNFMAAQAENSYYEENDLCDSDDENLQQICEDNRATWKMYELAWKAASGIGLICLIAAIFLPRREIEE